jgi:hypothetical protein
VGDAGSCVLSLESLFLYLILTLDCCSVLEALPGPSTQERM